MRAHEVRGEIAIAETEPRRRPVGGHRGETAEGLVGAAPAAPGVEHTGERVHDGVEIGRDVQAPDLGVVAGVDDDAQRGRIERRREAAEQLGGAGTARERDDSHGLVSGGHIRTPTQQARARGEVN